VDVDEGGGGGQRFEWKIGDRLGASAGVWTGLGQLGVETAEGKLVAIGSVPIDAAVPLIAAIGGWSSYLGEFNVGMPSRPPPVRALESWGLTRL